MVQSGAVPSQVSTEAEARSLAQRLLDGARLRPVVVVSSAAGQPEPYVDVEEVAAAVSGLAEVYLLPTGAVSWAFSSAMPPMTQVYGGASRVYPVDLGWVQTPRLSPLRFAFGPADRDRVTEALISDAMGMAMAAGLLQATTAAQAGTPLSGTVLGVVGNRALVTTDRGTVTVWPELTVPGLAAERLFTPGMDVSGVYDDAEKRLDVRGSLLPTEELLAAYVAGASVLGRVTRLDKGGCHVELVPGFRVFVAAADASADPATPLTALMSVDEVVAAAVVAVGEPTGKSWRLSLTDVGPAAHPYAAALLPGGPPWLVAPPAQLEPEVPVEEAVPEPVPATAAAPAARGVGPDVRPGAVPRDPALVALQAERDGFQAELAAAQHRIERLEAERVRLRTQAREAGNLAQARHHELQTLRAQLGASANDGSLFTDPVEQLRFDVHLAWARRTTPGEKADLPLRHYVVGEHFLQSWAEVDGIDRQKVIDVVVDVVTGRVHDLHGRGTHQLRESDGPTARPVVREDGSTCWRVALQQHTPQARRLHYWQRPDGSVELSSIRKHDDSRP